jgi:hypothetical protein
MALGSSQPLTEKSTKNLPGGEGRPARKTDNITVICKPAASTSQNPMGLHGLLQAELYLISYSTVCYDVVSSGIQSVDRMRLVGLSVLTTSEFY